MVGVAVVLLVLGRTHDGVLAGAAVAGYTLPAVLTGPLLGAWLANAGRRAPFALAANELVLAGVAVGLTFTVGHAPGVVVVLLTLLAGLSLPLTSGGYSSLLPALVGRDGLTRSNTVDAMSVNGPSIAGPAVAGTVAATLGVGASALGIGVIALLATVATFALPEVPVQQHERESLWRTTTAGLRHLARTPPLRAATLTSAVGYGSVGLLVVALPARVVEFGASRASAGYLWTALECGGLVGMLLVGPRLRRLRPERAVFVAVASYGVLLVVLAGMPTLTATLVVIVVAGIAEGPNLPAVFAARQRYSPERLLAQVSTTGASLKIGAFALGSVVSGALTGPIGPSAVILLAGLGQLAAVTVGWAIGRPADAVTTSAVPGRTP
jgi:MFS family permease